MDDEVLAVCGAQQRHIDEQQHGEGSRGVHQAGVGMREDERGGVKCKKTCHTGMPHQHEMLMLSSHVPVPVPGTGMRTWGIIL